MDDKDVGGRPRKIATPEKFDALVDAYVSHCAEEHKPMTLTGLVLALGFSDKTSFYDYENYEGFSHSVKRARSFIELGYEMRLFEASCTGAIFALKNMGWKDKLEHDVQGDLVVNIKRFDDGD